MSVLFRSVGTVFLMSILLGLGYPLAMTGISQLLFPGPANGSLVLGSNGKPLGSRLIGQDWSKSEMWLQGRPSATGDHAYNAQASGGSNLRPHGKVYSDRVAADKKTWEVRAAAAGQSQPVPQALLTASASGLD